MKIGMISAWLIVVVSMFVSGCERRVDLNSDNRDAVFVKEKVSFLSSSAIRIESVTIDDFHDLGIYGRFKVDRGRIPELFPVPEYTWYDRLEEPSIWRNQKMAFGSNEAPQGNVKTAVGLTKYGKLYVAIVDNDENTSPTGLFEYWEY